VNQHEPDIDERSVGELLMHADLTCRQVLLDPEAGNARALMRTWGELVEACVDLWNRIPGDQGDPVMSRIGAAATALHRSQIKAGWPGAGDTDDRLGHAGDTLCRAAELVASRRPTFTPVSAVVAADVDAARTRLMHTLYVGTHGVGVALSDYMTKAAEHLDRKGHVPPGESLTHARNAAARLGAVEDLARGYLKVRWPAALGGEYRGPPAATRVDCALAQWDVQAHRSLAGTPTTANLLLVAVIQRDVAVAGQFLTQAAARTHAIDPDQHASRLATPLADVEASWANLGRHLQQLTPRGDRRIDPALLLAGNELRASLREITHDGGAVATPDVMAQRTDLATASRSIHASTATAVELGHVLREVVQDPNVTVSAKGAHALATDQTGHHPVHAWIDAADLHHNRDVPLPQIVRETLTDAIGYTLSANMTANSAGTFLEQSTPQQIAAAASMTGRRHEDRTSPALAVTTPGHGCER